VNYKVAITEMYPQSPPWEPIPYSNYENEDTSLLGSYAILTSIQLPTLLSSIWPSYSVSNSLLGLHDCEDGALCSSKMSATAS